MSYPPIQFINSSLIFNQKVCFSEFSGDIHIDDKIVIVGENGAGKSSLLKIINSELNLSSGEIKIPHIYKIASIKQNIFINANNSGGENFNLAFSQALSENPDFLLLDEPTNHLDLHNKTQIIKFLENWDKGLLIATHDSEIIDKIANYLWIFEEGKINIFKGPYKDYLAIKQNEAEYLQNELLILHKAKKQNHQALMKEQKRARNSKLKGQKSIDKKKWPTITSKTKALRAEKTSGKNKLKIAYKKENIIAQLANIKLREEIKPKFSIDFSNLTKNEVLSATEGKVLYDSKEVLNNINIRINGGDRVAICGKNGSGKTTLLKAFLDDKTLTIKGKWNVVNNNKIGYLDQFYNNIDLNMSVYDHIRFIKPNWSQLEIRKHLNDFLFTKNHEVENIGRNLSGGEKARLSLAIIAAKTPPILMLDEITNNLDIITKQHVVDVLKKYQGTLIIISHDNEFLEEINIDNIYNI